MTQRIRSKDFIRRILVCCALVLASNIPATSAELRSTENDNCAWRIDGALREGDADRVVRVLSQASNMQHVPSSDRLSYSYFGTRVGVVCLNISGGLFSEGHSLMRFFRDSAWGTFVDDGEACLSSCAIAFMGGTSPNYDGETSLFRTLHVGGQLAFDLPRTLGNQNDAPSEGDVSRSIAGTIRELSREIAGEKIPYFRSDLLLSLFSLGEDDVYRIDSVKKAAAYHIALDSIPAAPANTDGDFHRNTCNNLVARAFGIGEGDEDEAWTRNESGSYEDEHLREYYVRLEDGALARQAELKSVYDLDGTTDTCVIGPLYSTFVSSRFGRGSYADITIDGRGSELFFAFHPDTSLSELAKQGKAAPVDELTEDSETPDVQISSYWSHNGSVLALLKSDEPASTFRAFIYAEPRPGLKELGVDVGSLLFDGTATNGTAYHGHARTFSCGSRHYPVSGSVSEDQQLIVMKGNPIRFDQSCNAIGSREDTLVFEFLGSASDPKFADKPRSLFGSIVPVRSILLQMQHL